MTAGLLAASLLAVANASSAKSQPAASPYPIVAHPGSKNGAGTIVPPYLSNGPVPTLPSSSRPALAVPNASAPTSPPLPTSPASNPAAETEIPIPPRLLPPAEAFSSPPNGSYPQAVPTAPALTGETPAPPGAMPAPPGAMPVPPPLTSRDRRHYRRQSCLWGFPSQFQRPPLGYFQYQHGQTEVANGTATFMTLYHYDFEDGSAKLNLHGRDQLAKMTSLLPQNFFPILIERTPEAPALAEARRTAVLNELAQGPFPIPPQRVVIGPSRGDDLRGVEAQVFNFGVMMQDRIGAMMGAMMGMGGMMGGRGGMGGGMGMGMGGGMGGMGGGMGGMGGGMGGMGGGMGGMGMGGMGMGMGMGR